MNSVTIVVYNDSPDVHEMCSFVQCVATLKTHKLYLVFPDGLDVSVYMSACALEGAIITMQPFEKKYFTSVSSYNSLMLSHEFYQRFREYEYILIYQLDAWIFADELDTWCAKGYDYIGAPWFSDRGEMLDFAGNGGLSLRRVPAFLEVLTRRGYANYAWNEQFLHIEHPAKTPFRAKVKKLLHAISMFFCRLSPRLFIKFNRDFEDITYAKVFSLLGVDRVAPPHIAAYFSFERFPEKLYELTGHKLPFGCHAFAKHNKVFWKDKVACTMSDAQ